MARKLLELYWPAFRSCWPMVAGRWSAAAA